MEKLAEGIFAIVLGLMAVIWGWGDPGKTAVDAGIIIAIIGGAWFLIGIIGIIVKSK
jgi:hypothetical protein